MCEMCLVYTDHGGMCYDSGHPFEQSEFMNSPMSEYGPGVGTSLLTISIVLWFDF
jgi:hypothetical protein